MNDKDVLQVDHLLSRPDKKEMMSPLSRLAVIDDSFGIGGVWFASGQEFHASEGFPQKAELAVFLASGEMLKETQHTRSWSPSACTHKRVLGDNQVVVRELKFIAREAVFDVMELINQTDKLMDLRLMIRGRASAKGTVSFKDGRIYVDEEEGRTLSGTHMVVAAEPRFSTCVLSPTTSEFGLDIEPVTRELYGDRVRYLAYTDIRLPASGRAKVALAVSWDFTKKQALSHLPRNLIYADTLLSEINKGWKDYWEERVPKLSVPDEGFRKLYYYGAYVLRAQQMPPQGRLPHIHITPTKFAHVGTWLQDNAYIAIGSRWTDNTGLPQNAIRLLEKNQFSNGLIPSSINACGVRVYDRKTGRGVTLDIRDMKKRAPEEVPSQVPSVFTIAADEVFKKTWNLDFLRDCYQAALKLDKWIANEREDENGLFKAVHLMDIEHCAGSRRMEGQEFIRTVDVSALNVYHRRLIAEWAGYLKETRTPAGVEERANRTARGIKDLCWDDRRGFFYDLMADGSTSPVETAAGFYTLFAFGQDMEQARLHALLSALEDRSRFGTIFPVPTVSGVSGEYGQGVSQSVDWFVINGLIRHGLNEPAEKMMRKLLRAHLPNGLPESREGFDTRTGDGKGSPDFAWVGLANDLLITRVLGIRPKLLGLTLEPWLFDSWENASIHGFTLGPYSVDVDYSVGKINSTIKIKPVPAGKAYSALPVDIVWRTRPGDRVDNVEIRSGSYVVEGLDSQNRQTIRISDLLCPHDGETQVNIRTHKALRR